VLGAGQFREILLNGRNRISANRPILVCQYSNSTTFDGTPGDPFMMVIPPVAQYQDDCTFTTPATGFATHWINVVAPTDLAAAGLVRLDSGFLAPSLFAPIGSTDFSAAQVSITPGSHVLEASEPIWLSVYGFNADDSYGYPGGMSLRNLGG
jgi:hypothetical protein